jgi:hypothetical protein
MFIATADPTTLAAEERTVTPPIIFLSPSPTWIGPGRGLTAALTPFEIPVVECHTPTTEHIKKIALASPHPQPFSPVYTLPRGEGSKILRSYDLGPIIGGPALYKHFVPTGLRLFHQPAVLLPRAKATH